MDIPNAAAMKERLSPEQYMVCFLKGTEPPFSGKYANFKGEGTFMCIVCGQELFSSDTKFDSGTGWPSFWEVVGPDKVNFTEDHEMGMARTEVTCKQCGSHLGHVFNDGPAPTGKRYCINSLSLDFKPKTV